MQEELSLQVIGKSGVIELGRPRRRFQDFYKRFAAHGGDWGSTVSEHLARNHSDSVIDIHLTDVPFAHIFQKPNGLSDHEQKFLAQAETWQKNGAYALIQGTRPQSLAHALNDSPAGLAAWLREIPRMERLRW